MVKPIQSRSFRQLSKVWYHGTSSHYYDSLIDRIDLKECNDNTDFGKGFYLTSNFTQASNHAKSRSKIDGSPIVLVFELSVLDLKRGYEGKTWYEMNLDWANFIYSNRSSDNKEYHEYDYVYGAVADGRMDQIIDKRDNGEIDDLTFLAFISNYPNYDQLSIHNPSIIDYNIIKRTKVVTAYAKTKEFKGSRTTKS